MARQKETVSVKNKNVRTSRLSGEVLGILLLAAGVMLGIFIYFPYEAPFAKLVRVVFFGLFGLCAYVIPLAVGAGGVAAIAYAGREKNKRRQILIIAEILFLLSLIEEFSLRIYSANAIGYFSYLKQCFESGRTAAGGGVLGGILAYPAEFLLGNVGAIILFGAFTLCGAMLITHFSIKDTAKKIGEAIKENRESLQEAKRQQEDLYIRESAKHVEKAYIKSFAHAEDADSSNEKEVAFNKDKDLEQDRDLYIDDVSPKAAASMGLSLLNDTYGEFPPALNRHGEVQMGPFGASEDSEEEKSPIEPERPMAKPVMKKSTQIKAVMPGEREEDSKEEKNIEAAVKAEYQLPNRIDLLDSPKPLSQSKGDAKKRQNTAEVLVQTLKNFNIEAEVINIVKGPTVTRYELQPAPGVKVSRIVALSNDIALNLAAPSIRIEAPIPGKAAIGIEVPNVEVSLVTIREMIDTDEFRNIKSKLVFAVGKDITGKNVYGDLAKMPHILIAGTTGAGKSVCVNGIIMSILYKASPEEVVFLMVDPKVVEMKKFNGIPHMKTDVVTDPKKAPNMLNWAVKEMLDRYKVFAEAGVKNIDRYNELKEEAGEKIMPKVVIIVDELADLMMASAHEVEDAICRIAQLGRASGIHLVIATQSPRVDVITGLIKANIPSRIAFTVSSSIDSRTILDMGGAEKLLGKGDMLYMPVGQNKPVRLQGCYLSDEENERVISFLKDEIPEGKFDDELAREIETGASSSAGEDGKTFDDDLVPKAIELALEYEQISTSMLQRRLKVGYARAARLVDELEQNQIVTPAEGNKPRQILITWEDYRRMFGGEDVTDEWR